MKRISIVAISAILSLTLPSTMQATGADGGTTNKKKLADESGMMLNKFRIAAGGGYSHQLGKRVRYDDPVLNELTKDLKNTYNLNLDAQYFFDDFWGVGVDLNYIKANADHASGIEIDNQYIYIAPTFAIRYNIDRIDFLTTMGMGVQMLKQEVKGAEENKSHKKNIFAANVGFSAEYRVMKEIGIGAKIALAGGSASNKKKYYKTTKSKANLSNILIGAFASFYFD